MKFVYIIGPFTAPTSWEVEQNVRAAEELALEVAKLGAFPVCPHTNTRFFHGQCDAGFWYDGTMELLKRTADAVILVDQGNFTDSEGSEREIKFCQAQGIPVFHRLGALAEWLPNTEALEEAVADDSGREPPDIMYRPDAWSTPEFRRWDNGIETFKVVVPEQNYQIDRRVAVTVDSAGSVLYGTITGINRGGSEHRPGSCTITCRREASTD